MLVLYLGQWGRFVRVCRSMTIFFLRSVITSRLFGQLVVCHVLITFYVEIFSLCVFVHFLIGVLFYFYVCVSLCCISLCISLTLYVCIIEFVLLGLFIYWIKNYKKIGDGWFSFFFNLTINIPLLIRLNFHHMIDYKISFVQKFTLTIQGQMNELPSEHSKGAYAKFGKSLVL